MLSIKNGILCFFLILYSICAYTETGIGKYSLKGIAVDEQNLAVPYVNVLIYNESDSNLITAEIADSLGNFELKLKKPGTYRLQLQILGYKSSIQKHLVLTSDSKNIDLGSVTLTPDITLLEEVGVVGEKKAVEFKIDKKVINLDKLPNAAGGTVAEALEDVPSVKTDMDGNILLRGSSNFKVYVDGKPSMLDADQALKQIPADAVEKVELITNPSAKYDVDGTAGIINIVMKKNRANGFNAYAHASYSTGNKYSGDLLMNYKFKKINIFLGADYRRGYFAGEGGTYTEYYNNTQTLYEAIAMDEEFDENDYIWTYGFDIDLTPKNSFSFTGIIKTYPHKYINNSKYTNWTNSGDSIFTNRYNNKEISGKPIRFIVSDVHKFNENGHELSSYAFIGYKTHLDHHDFRRDTLLADNTISDSYLYNRKTDRPEIETRLNITYSYPITEHAKIETGYNLNNQYTYYENYEEIKDETGTLLWSTTEGSDYDYNKQEQATFINYSGEQKKLSYQAGLRMEYYHQTLKENREDFIVDNKKLDFFPSAFIKYEFNDKWNLNTNYSRRMNRLSIYQLNPLVYFNDGSYEYRGNPNLIPSYSNNSELEISGKIPSTSINATLFVRDISNSTFGITELIDGVRVRHPDNLDRETVWGTETSFETKIGKHVKLIYGTSIVGEKLKGIAGKDTIDKKGSSWDVQFRTELKLNSGTLFQFRMYYGAPSIRVQGESQDYFVTGASVKQTLFDDKMKITLRVRDIFSTRKWEYTTQASNFYSEQFYIPESPIYTLSVSYNFNSFKSKRGDIQDSGSGGGGSVF